MSITEYNQDYFERINNIYYEGRQEELKFLCEDYEILTLKDDLKKLELFQKGKKLIYTSNEKIQGFIVLNDSLISMLYVSKDFQGQGVARKLLNASYNFFKQEAYLNVAENNIKALNLYKSEGFKEIGKFEVSFNNNKVFAVKMRKEI